MFGKTKTCEKKTSEAAKRRVAPGLTTATSAPALRWTAAAKAATADAALWAESWMSRPAWEASDSAASRAAQTSSVRMASVSPMSAAMPARSDAACESGWGTLGPRPSQGQGKSAADMPMGWRVFGVRVVEGKAEKRDGFRHAVGRQVWGRFLAPQAEQRLR